MDTEESTEIFFEDSDAPVVVERHGKEMRLIVLDKDDHQDTLCSASTTATEMRWLAIAILEMAQTADGHVDQT